MIGFIRTISAIGGFHFNAAKYRFGNFGRSFYFYKKNILCKKRRSGRDKKAGTASERRPQEMERARQKEQREQETMGIGGAELENMRLRRGTE